MKRRIFLAFCMGCLMEINSFDQVFATRSAGDFFKGRQANMNDDELIKTIENVSKTLNSSKTALRSFIATFLKTGMNNTSNLSASSAAYVTVTDWGTALEIILPILTELRNAFALISGQQTKGTVRAMSKVETSKLTGSNAIFNLLNLFCVFSSDILTSIANVFIVLKSGNFEQCPQDALQKLERAITPLKTALSGSQQSIGNNCEQSLNQWVDGFQYADGNVGAKIQRISSEIAIMFEYSSLALDLFVQAVKGQNVQQESQNALTDFLNAVNQACGSEYSEEDNGYNDDYEGSYADNFTDDEYGDDYENNYSDDLISDSYDDSFTSDDNEYNEEYAADSDLNSHRDNSTADRIDPNRNSRSYRENRNRDRMGNSSRSNNSRNQARSQNRGSAQGFGPRRANSNATRSRQ
ncbi:MAG: hypothetical protein E7015_01745 [Alphaproteobacteria bacterium]|nr:hypothetical protein [Alphaproteobacteria bacterium]